MARTRCSCGGPIVAGEGYEVCVKCSETRKAGEMTNEAKTAAWYVKEGVLWSPEHARFAEKIGDRGQDRIEELRDALNDCRALKPKAEIAEACFGEALDEWYAKYKADPAAWSWSRRVDELEALLRRFADTDGGGDFAGWLEVSERGYRCNYCGADFFGNPYDEPLIVDHDEACVVRQALASLQPRIAVAAELVAEPFEEAP